MPVLMYVLARSNLPEMLLNVEYMMELMDPALQLGEGESPARPASGPRGGSVPPGPLAYHRPRPHQGHTRAQPNKHFLDARVH